MLVTIFEWLGYAMFLYLCVTQLLLPWARGSMYFPLFRHTKEAKLRHELARAKQHAVEEQLQAELTQYQPQPSHDTKKTEEPPSGNQS